MSKPAHKLRNGVLQVTIWRNSGDKGNWYSVVPTRSYKNGDGHLEGNRQPQRATTCCRWPSCPTRPTPGS